MMKTRIAIPVPPGASERKYFNYFAALSQLGAEPGEYGLNAGPNAWHGLLLPGGKDISPGYYHQADIACGELDPQLDELQFAALEAFVKAGKPVFGICRGHQLINVFFEGTLIQHLQAYPGHQWVPETGEDRVHLAFASAGSWLESIYGADFQVNSAHHQAVDTLGKGLIVDLRVRDGIIEAMHHASYPVWSVQWHPERMCYTNARPDAVDGSRVLRWFVDRCAELQ